MAETEWVSDFLTERFKQNWILNHEHGGGEDAHVAQARAQALAQVRGPAGAQAAADHRGHLPGRRPAPAGTGRLQQGAEDLLAPVRAVARRVAPQQQPGAPRQQAGIEFAHVVLSFLAATPAFLSAPPPVTRRAASAIRTASARKAADPPSVSP